jgi:hypothetical protein
MNFISTIEWWFDPNLSMSECLSIKHDQNIDRLKDKSTWRLTGWVIKRNPLMTADFNKDKNEDLLYNYEQYCEEHEQVLMDWFEEYLRDLGYSSTEWVEDGYEKYCRESYSEVCSKEELPLFDKLD